MHPAGGVDRDADAEDGTGAEECADDVVGQPEQRVQGGVQEERYADHTQDGGDDDVQRDGGGDVSGAEPLDVVVPLVRGPSADADGHVQGHIQQVAAQRGRVLGDHLTHQAVGVVVEMQGSQDGCGNARDDAEHQRVHPGHYHVVTAVSHRVSSCLLRMSRAPSRCIMV